MDVTYKGQMSIGRVTVNGYQIGRFAVRQTPPGYKLAAPNGTLRVTRAWLIDHINTGATILSLDTFEDAVLVADDMSRFAARDVNTRGIERLAKQLGPEIISWLSWVNLNNKVVDFRNWRKN